MRDFFFSFLFFLYSPTGHWTQEHHKEVSELAFQLILGLREALFI